MIGSSAFTLFKGDDVAKYTGQDASNELRELESRLLDKTVDLLENENIREVADILVSLNRELYETHREARKLRLRGALDVEVYKTLMAGYARIEGRIMECAKVLDREEELRGIYLTYTRHADRSRREE